jgi:polyisoprenyl-phosphate glycosyltransferase
MRCSRSAVNAADGEPLIRKFISFIGYRVISALANIDIPRDTGEFRIMNRRVIDELLPVERPPDAER